MSETTFTPGPWSVNPQNGLFIEGTFRPDPRIAYCYAAFTDCPMAEAEANARLIAAAPDLYIALKQFVNWHGGAHEADCPCDDSCDCAGKPTNDLVNRAIRKAEDR